MEELYNVFISYRTDPVGQLISQRLADDLKSLGYFRIQPHLTSSNTAVPVHHRCLFSFFCPTTQHAGSQFPHRELSPLQWKRRVLNAGPPRKSWLSIKYYTSDHIIPLFTPFKASCLIRSKSQNHHRTKNKASRISIPVASWIFLSFVSPLSSTCQTGKEFFFFFNLIMVYSHPYPVKASIWS